MLIFQVYLNIHSHFPGPFPASKRFWGSQSPESVWNCDQHWPVSNGFWVSGIHPSNKKHHITVWRSDLILPRKLLAFKRYLFIRIRPVKSWPCLDPQGGPFWALRCLSDLHLVNQKVRYYLWRGKGLSVGMILREKGKLDRVSQGGRLSAWVYLKRIWVKRDLIYTLSYPPWDALSNLHLRTFSLEVQAHNLNNRYSPTGLFFWPFFFLIQHWGLSFFLNSSIPNLLRIKFWCCNWAMIIKKGINWFFSVFLRMKSFWGCVLNKDNYDNKPWNIRIPIN